MICFVTIQESSYWIQTTTQQVKKDLQNGHYIAAIRIGQWIYDLILASSCKNISPIRYWDSK